MKRIDLTGHIFGRLLVTSFSHSHIQPSGNKRAMWNVKCSCGTEKVVPYAHLAYGNTTSCGCLKHEGNAHKKPLGVASFNAKYASYVQRAKRHKKELAFELTKEEFKNIITQQCHYCGCEGSEGFLPKPNTNGIFKSNGIDRIDSSLGYVSANCVPCCTICNKMKLDLSYDEFINHVKRIYNAFAKIKKS
jgi:hypothetical protein